MDTIEKQELATRTRERNALTWLSLDYGGIMAPLVAMETDLDTLAAPGIENYLAISDEAWGIKESQRDQTVELSQAEVDQDRLLADEKAATARAKIAIERAADEYVLAAKVLDAVVKGLIMGAKEFAALVELEQLANEALQVGLSIEKELLRRYKVQADIYLETINQAQVEADLVRADLEVTKAELAVKREELRLKEITAKIYYATIERAQVDVDVDKAYLDVDKAHFAVDKEGVRAKDVGASIYNESVNQAQADADLAKMQLEIAKANLVVAQENLHVKEANAKVYYEFVQQAQVGSELARKDFEVDKTELDASKEGVRTAKVQKDIYLQTIEQQMVEADIAKSQVDVAKAHVRAVMSGIEAGKAEIELIEAETQKYIAEADKATLQADVASIFAEIMVKKLTTTKLAVGKAEIAAGYTYIQSKLNDVLALYETKKLIETIKTEAEAALFSESGLALAVEKAQENLRNVEADYARLTFAHKESQTDQSIADETDLKQKLVTARKALADAKLEQSIDMDDAKTAAAKLINAAHKATYKFSEHTTTTLDRETEYVSGE